MKIVRTLQYAAIVAAISGAAFAEGAPSVQPLWPGRAPGETKDLPAEGDTTRPGDELIAGARLIRLGNVSTPTITIFRPPPEKDTGATVVVCPGGGYYILAWDLEGTEVCAWLNSIGVTGVLLKYRVPVREGRPNYEAPLQDVQRAVGMVRHQAKALGLDPARIGVLGFSAGAHLSAALGANFAARTYPAIDAADALSCRPDFAVLVYPGLLVDEKAGRQVRPEVAPRKGATPPTLVVMAQDDPVGVNNALGYYGALQDAGVPAGMHLYPTGGHGYGLRRTENPVTHWPDRVAEWLKAGGWLHQP